MNSDGCFAQNLREPGEEKYIVTDTKEMKKKLFRDGSLGFGPFAKILRRSMIMEQKLFFPEELAYEDMYWPPLLYIYAEKTCILEEKLYHYVVNSNSITLSPNASHHRDILAIQLMKWTDYEKRGLLQEFQEELEKDALSTAVCAMQQMIVLQKEPSFSFFEMERKMMKERISEDRYNYYRADMGLISRLLLDILYLPLNETEFSVIVRQIKERLIK